LRPLLKTEDTSQKKSSVFLVSAGRLKEKCFLTIYEISFIWRPKRLVTLLNL